MANIELIAEEIKKALKIDVYSNTRTQDTVDARSLYCYILRNDLNMTLYDIRDTITSKGRNYNHATVLHSERMYQEVVSRKPHFDYVRDNILQKISSRYALIKKINQMDERKIKLIEQCVNNNL